MRNRLIEQGVLLIVSAVLLVLLIMDWQVGPEFWPAVPTFALLGALILREAL